MEDNGFTMLCWFLPYINVNLKPTIRGELESEKEKLKELTQTVLFPLRIQNLTNTLKWTLPSSTHPSTSVWVGHDTLCPRVLTHTRGTENIMLCCFQLFSWLHLGDETGFAWWSPCCWRRTYGPREEGLAEENKCFPSLPTLHLGLSS